MDTLLLPLLNKEPRFELKVENRTKNIFVTQFDDCSIQSNNHDEIVTHIPVITESSNSILNTSVNTLQKTLLLKTQVQVEKVDRELIQKRLEFENRMRALEQRRAKLLQKQQETKDKATKFEQFVMESEAKQRRALKKYQDEREKNELRKDEILELCAQLEQLQMRHHGLKEQVAKYKIYEDYMMKVLDLLPENSLEYGAKSLLIPIIRLHETLSITHQDLLQRLESHAEELDQGQQNLDLLKQEHSTSKLMINKELAELQSEWDHVKEKNKQLEMTLHMQQGQSRDQVEETASLFIAVKNLGQQCHLQYYGPLENMDMLTTMDMIKEFMMEKADILRTIDLSSNLTKRSKDRRRKELFRTRNTFSKSTSEEQQQKK